MIQRGSDPPHAEIRRISGSEAYLVYERLGRTSAPYHTLSSSPLFNFMITAYSHLEPPPLERCDVPQTLLAAIQFRHIYTSFKFHTDLPWSSHVMWWASNARMWGKSVELFCLHEFQVMTQVAIVIDSSGIQFSSVVAAHHVEGWGEVRFGSCRMVT